MVCKQNYALSFIFLHCEELLNLPFNTSKFILENRFNIEYPYKTFK